VTDDGWTKTVAYIEQLCGWLESWTSVRLCLCAS